MEQDDRTVDPRKLFINKPSPPAVSRLSTNRRDAWTGEVKVSDDDQQLWDEIFPRRMFGESECFANDLSRAITACEYAGSVEVDDSDFSSFVLSPVTSIDTAAASCKSPAAQIDHSSTESAHHITSTESIFNDAYLIPVLDDGDVPATDVYHEIIDQSLIDVRSTQAVSNTEQLTDQLSIYPPTSVPLAQATFDSAEIDHSIYSSSHIDNVASIDGSYDGSGYPTTSRSVEFPMLGYGMDGIEMMPIWSLEMIPWINLNSDQTSVPAPNNTVHEASAGPAPLLPDHATRNSRRHSAPSVSPPPEITSPLSLEHLGSNTAPSVPGKCRWRRHSDRWQRPSYQPGLTVVFESGCTSNNQKDIACVKGRRSKPLSADVRQNAKRVRQQKSICIRCRKDRQPVSAP
jgi:hypothetical protein